MMRQLVFNGCAAVMVSYFLLYKLSDFSLKPQTFTIQLIEIFDF
jgi:hypothetical protein